MRDPATSQWAGMLEGARALVEAVRLVTRAETKLAAEARTGPQVGPPGRTSKTTQVPLEPTTTLATM